MNAILAIMMKDIRLLLRDRMGFFFAFAFPILISGFFGTIFGGSGGSGSGDSAKIDILLVDEDQTDGSRAFGKTLSGASEFKVTPSPTRQEASDMVRRGKSTAFIALPKGFGKSREQMFFGSGSSIVLGVDPSRSAEAGMLEGLLTKYGFMQMQDGFRDPEAMRKQVRSSLDGVKGSTAMGDADKRVFEKFFGDLDQFLVDVPRKNKPAAPGATPMPDAAAPSDAGTAGPGGWQPIRIEKADVVVAKENTDGPAVKNSYAWTFPQGMIWGFIGCAMSFAVALVLERSRGTMLRLRVAPLCPMQILTGKALACFVMTQIVGWLLVALAYFVFDVRPTSWPTLAVAMLCTSNCFVGIMLLTSVLSQSERAAAGLGWGVMLIFSMIGGGMIPLFIMKGWMQTLSLFSPVRWAILALEGGIWRNMGPGEMLLPCGILVGIGMIGYWAATWAFGKTEGS